jgi:hypothetical protein
MIPKAFIFIQSNSIAAIVISLGYEHTLNVDFKLDQLYKQCHSDQREES